MLIQVVKNTTSEEKRAKYYDKGQVNQILIELDQMIRNHALSDIIYATYIKLLLFTGVRASEALALQWSDINFTNQTVQINKTLSNDSKTAEAPKTKSSIRTIEIDDETIKMLKDWRKTQLAKCWELGSNQQPKLVFYNFMKKTYYKYPNMLRMHADFCDSRNIQYLGGLHCFRHTHATMCVNAGMNYKILQERLGHDDISMTMNVYAKALPENKRTALDNVVSFMKEA